MTARKTIAAKAEALGDRIEFTFRGKTYAIDPATEWSVDVLEAIEDGRVTHAAREILGDGWETFKAAMPKTKDLGELMEAIGSAAGTQGN